MRIRDRIFEEDWEKIFLSVRGSNIAHLTHHISGAITFALITIQSAISLNYIPFAIWLLLGVISVSLDFFSNESIGTASYLRFGFLLIFGTIISMFLVNFDSIFFQSTFGRIDIILWQIIIGLFIVVRLFMTFFYMEYFKSDFDIVKPRSNYSRNQLEQYEQNLIKTDFEFKKVASTSFWQKLSNMLGGFLWPLIILILLTLLSVGYAFLIYFMIPSNAIAELNVRPALIFMAVLYSVLLIRASAILPKTMKKKTSITENQDESIKRVEKPE